MILITGSIVATPATVDEIRAQSVAHSQRSRREDGCLHHATHIDAENPMRLVFVAPWREAKAIADGPSILKYIRETATEYGVEKHIRYHHRVVGASWSSTEARWTVQVERGEAREPVTITCGFLLVCTGYYNYARGYV